MTVVLIGFALPTSVKTIQDKTRKPFIFGQEETSFLSSLTTEDKILICPEGSNIYHSSLIKVSTPAQVYLANPGQLELVGSDKTKAEDFKLTKITETKFIIITHHALTMSNMNRLYGVTMPEKGVSQLVSVDLQKAEELVA